MNMHSIAIILTVIRTYFFSLKNLTGFSQEQVICPQLTQLEASHMVKLLISFFHVHEKNFRRVKTLICIKQQK